MSKVLRTGHGLAARSPELKVVSNEDALALVKASKSSHKSPAGSFEVDICVPGGTKRKVKFTTVHIPKDDQTQVG